MQEQTRALSVTVVRLMFAVVSEWDYKCAAGAPSKLRVGLRSCIVAEGYPSCSCSGVIDSGSVARTSCLSGDSYHLWVIGGKELRKGYEKVLQLMLCYTPGDGTNCSRWRLFCLWKNCQQAAHGQMERLERNEWTSNSQWCKRVLFYLKQPVWNPHQL